MPEKDPLNLQAILTYIFGGGAILALWGWMVNTIWNMPKDYSRKHECDKIEEEIKILHKESTKENKKDHDKIFDKIDEVQKTITKHLTK